MMHHHNYSLSDIENMIPWERGVYTALLMKALAEETARYKEQQFKSKSR